MAVPLPAEECETLTKAFSGLGGLGVDESSMLSTAAKWRSQPEKKGHFRKSFSSFFTVHEGSFERCHDDYIEHFQTEFTRFQNLMVLWVMHPWERDARWIHHVLHKDHPFATIAEIACTRSSDELLGARKAYHALYHKSMEEDIAYHVRGNYSHLLVGLVSSYRYEGPRVDEEVARSEAKALANAIKNAGEKKPAENAEVIRILTTRSKQHLRATFKYYKEMHGKSAEEDLGNDLCLQEAVQCLDSPPKYFSKLIDSAFKDGADKHEKNALTRVIVSRVDVDIEEIKDAYSKEYGVKLQDKIAKNTHGNYRDALISLLGN